MPATSAALATPDTATSNAAIRKEAQTT
jgi:hypothetical protein